MMRVRSSSNNTPEVSWPWSLRVTTVASRATQSVQRSVNDAIVSSGM